MGQALGFMPAHRMDSHLSKSVGCAGRGDSASEARKDGGEGRKRNSSATLSREKRARSVQRLAQVHTIGAKPWMTSFTLHAKTVGGVQGHGFLADWTRPLHPQNACHR